MRRTQTVLLKVLEFKERVLKDHGPEGLAAIRDYVHLLRDKQRLIDHLKSRYEDLSGLAREHPEIGLPIDWPRFHEQITSAVRSVSESGVYNTRGRLNAEIEQTLATFIYIAEYMNNFLEQLRDDQGGLCIVHAEEAGQ